ncbi:hypothetical protein AA958_04305 [Streptomyces sp. CNQ-509]|nr:hypothetical protein AA958_04305 [Streptomyces sp. CNQ-509]
MPLNFFSIEGPSAPSSACSAFWAVVSAPSDSPFPITPSSYGSTAFSSRPFHFPGTVSPSTVTAGSHAMAMR